MKPELLKLYYQRYKIIVFPILVALAGILIIYLGIYKQVSLYLNGVDETSRLQDRITRLTAKAKALESLDTSGLQGELDTSLKALPADKDLANLIGSIQSLASANNVVLITVTLGQSASDSKAKFNPFLISLEVGGGSTEFKQFVNALEKTNRVMKVVTLDLSPTVASGSASGTASVELYFAPTPSEVGALDAPLPAITSKEQQILSDLGSSQSQGTGTAPQSNGSTGASVDVPKGKTNPFQ